MYMKLTIINSNIAYMIAWNKINYILRNVVSIKINVLTYKNE